MPKKKIKFFLVILKLGFWWICQKIKEKLWHDTETSHLWPFNRREKFSKERSKKNDFSRFSLQKLFLFFLVNVWGQKNDSFMSCLLTDSKYWRKKKKPERNFVKYKVKTIESDRKEIKKRKNVGDSKFKFQYFKSKITVWGCYCFLPIFFLALAFKFFSSSHESIGSIHGITRLLGGYYLRRLISSYIFKNRKVIHTKNISWN